MSAPRLRRERPTRALSLASWGLLDRLRERRFADGAWHPLSEAVEACWHLIPIEIAVRQAARQRDVSGLSLEEQIWSGRRTLTRRALRKLGAEFRRASDRPGAVEFCLPSSARRGRLRGVEHPSAKLDDEAIAEARRAYAAGEATQEELAHALGISQRVLAKALSGRTWTDKLRESGSIDPDSRRNPGLSALPPDRPEMGVSIKFTDEQYAAVVNRLRGLGEVGWVLADDLVKDLGINRRLIRAIVSAADGVDLLIGESSTGYTLARTQAEARQMTEKLASQAKQMQLRADRRQAYAARLPER